MLKGRNDYDGAKEPMIKTMAGKTGNGIRTAPGRKKIEVATLALALHPIELRRIFNQPSLLNFRHISNECLLPRLHHLRENDPVGFPILSGKSAHIQQNKGRLLKPSLKPRRRLGYLQTSNYSDVHATPSLPRPSETYHQASSSPHERNSRL